MGPLLPEDLQRLVRLEVTRVVVVHLLWGPLLRRQPKRVVVLPRRRSDLLATPLLRWLCQSMRGWLMACHNPEQSWDLGDRGIGTLVRGKLF